MVGEGGWATTYIWAGPADANAGNLPPSEHAGDGDDDAAAVDNEVLTAIYGRRFFVCGAVDAAHVREAAEDAPLWRVAEYALSSAVRTGPESRCAVDAAAPSPTSAPTPAIIAAYVAFVATHAAQTFVPEATA